MKHAFSGLGAIVLGLLVIGAIIFGGWQLGWWFSVHNAERQGQLINIQGHNFRKSYGFQQTLRDQITSLTQSIASLNVQVNAVSDKQEKQALGSQRYAILGQLCGDAAQLSSDPLTPSQAQMINQNCVAGAVSPSSPYAPQP